MTAVSAPEPYKDRLRRGKGRLLLIGALQEFRNRLLGRQIFQERCVSLFGNRKMLQVRMSLRHPLDRDLREDVRILPRRT